MDFLIEELTAPDLALGFLESLGSLTAVHLTPEEALPVFRERLRAGIRTYIARVDGRVIGTASLLLEKKFIHKGGREHQKQGVGTALVKHITEEARKLGCYKVILNCFDHLAPFYARIGYHKQDVGLRIDL
jgi:glucosamine-phosphate N-acetyltransferase